MRPRKTPIVEPQEAKALVSQGVYLARRAVGFSLAECIAASLVRAGVSLDQYLDHPLVKDHTFHEPTRLAIHNAFRDYQLHGREMPPTILCPRLGTGDDIE